jgi:hypothetical protein
LRCSEKVTTTVSAVLPVFCAGCSSTKQTAARRTAGLRAILAGRLMALGAARRWPRTVGNCMFIADCPFEQMLQKGDHPQRAKFKT